MERYEYQFFDAVDDEDDAEDELEILDDGRYDEMLEQFRSRILDQLNALGQEGWRVVHYEPHRDDLWPAGRYLLMRTLV